MSASPPLPLLEIDLAAAVVTLNQQAPQILVARNTQHDLKAPDLWSLPSGRFEPTQSRTLEIALRGFVSTQAGCELGYVEQLYTFGDRGRAAESEEGHRHVVSIGYLALTNALVGQTSLPRTARLHPWYGFFPWED